QPKPYQVLPCEPTYHWNGRRSQIPITLMSGSAPSGVNSTLTSYSSGGSSPRLNTARPGASDRRSPPSRRQVPRRTPVAVSAPESRFTDIRGGGFAGAAGAAAGATAARGGGAPPRTPTK